MKLDDWLTDLARRSGLLAQVEAFAANIARSHREEREARARAVKRDRIVSALDRTGLTSKDAERLLRWAEPGLLNADEALRLVETLHIAIGNIRSGPGILASMDRAKDPSLSEIFQVRVKLYDPTTSKSDRLKIAKTMAWWDEVVFSLYIAELNTARNQGKKGPSEIAKEAVGRLVGMSTASIHAACQRARDENKGQTEGVSEPMDLQSFERWLECGGPLFG